MFLRDVPSSNGLRLVVSAGVLNGQLGTGEVILSTDVLNTASDDDLIAAIRESAPKVGAMSAVFQAEYLHDGYLRSLTIDALQSEIEFFLRFLGNRNAFTSQEDYDTVARAKSPLDKILIAKRQRITKRRNRRALRSDIKTRYNDLLVALGRRDGFQCACCGPTTDLTLDHIVPISRGGTNELDNLQILCDPCNTLKGTQTIDYRGVTS